MSIVQKINIFQTIYERGQLPDQLINASIKGQPLTTNEYLDLKKKQNSPKILSLRLIPNYFELNQGPNDHDIKVVSQYNWGYSIKLDGFTSIDHYLESQFKSKKRSIIRRYVRRLETCFQITYHLYYGKITRETYEEVFSALHSMIKARFDQRNETHKEMWRWEELKKKTYGQILNKQASLFVIYDDETPIEVSLNYHMGPVLFSSVSSYDMDYAKFGLGHVEIYKQLEWCMANGYSLFEMGVGGMDYKKRWSNKIYRFNHWIIIPKTSFFLQFIGKIEYWKIWLKEYLKSKKINELRDLVVQRLSRKKERIVPMGNYSIKLSENKPEEKSLVECHSNELFKTGLKNVLNDLLYQLERPKKNATIYTSEDSSKGYWIKIDSQWFSVHRTSP